MVGERDEIVTSVERCRLLILRVDNDRYGSDLRGRFEGAAKRVHQKMLARSLAAKAEIDGEPTQERCGHGRILGKLSGYVRRPRSDVDTQRRESVVAENRVVLAFAQNKRSGHVLARVLPRLCLPVTIE